MGLPSNCMESQCSVEETCSDRFFCGESESFLRVIFPRTPSRCCSGSTLAPSSYLVNVNASRSSARQLTTEAQKTQRTQKNFTPVSPLFYVAFALPLQRAQHPLPPRRSTTELFLASESRPGNHTFWQPDRAILCLPLPTQLRNPSCSQRCRSFVSRARQDLQSIVPWLSGLRGFARCSLPSLWADVRLRQRTI